VHDDIPDPSISTSPKAFSHENGPALTGRRLREGFAAAQYGRERGRRKTWWPTGEPEIHIACDDVLVAVGQEELPSPVGSREGYRQFAFDKWGIGRSSTRCGRCNRRCPNVFFRRRWRRFGPQETIIWAVGAWATDAAISIDKITVRGEERGRPAAAAPSTSPARRLGIHEWSYDKRHLERSALQR